VTLRRRCLALWREGLRELDHYCAQTKATQEEIEEAFVSLVRGGQITEKELTK
jgi:hypothetical protein